MKDWRDERIALLESALSQANQRIGRLMFELAFERRAKGDAKKAVSQLVAEALRDCEAELA